MEVNMNTSGNQTFSIPADETGKFFLTLARKYKNPGFSISAKDRVGWKAVYIKQPNRKEIKQRLARLESELEHVQNTLAIIRSVSNRHNPPTAHK
jgi:hypothetical protein